MRVREESEKIIQIDSGADRRLVPFEEIGKETITVTFGNGTSGEYPVRVTFDGEEYNVKLTGGRTSGKGRSVT